MTNRKALEALREKVEAGECRPYEIEEAAMDVWPADIGNVRRWEIYTNAKDAYEGSIDAAVALLEAVLPGWTWEMTGEGVATLYRPYGDEWDYSGDAEVQENPARALLLAIIKAKLEECDDE